MDNKRVGRKDVERGTEAGEKREKRDEEEGRSGRSRE